MMFKTENKNNDTTSATTANEKKMFALMLVLTIMTKMIILMITDGISETIEILYNTHTGNGINKKNSDDDKKIASLLRMIVTRIYSDDKDTSIIIKTLSPLTPETLS